MGLDLQSTWGRRINILSGQKEGVCSLEEIHSGHIIAVETGYHKPICVWAFVMCVLTLWKFSDQYKK